MRMLDLTGKTFGRWRVVGRAANTDKGQARWLCRCECGNEGVIKSIVLRRGLSRSCGCLKREEIIRRSTKHGHSPAFKASPTYHTWAGMLARCTNPKHRNFACYGGRGITVCKRWMTFVNFLADMGEKPPGMSLERIRNERGYTPKNCEWATPERQARNRRNNHLLTFRGKTQTLAEWAESTGIRRGVISDRLAEGWSVEDALTRPATGHVRMITFRGETRSLADWACHLGINPSTLYQRLHRGWTFEEAIS